MSLVGYLLNLLTQKGIADISQRMHECEMHHPLCLVCIMQQTPCLSVRRVPTLLGQSDVKKVSHLPAPLWHEVNLTIPTMSPGHTFLFVLMPEESSAKAIRWLLCAT